MEGIRFFWRRFGAPVVALAMVLPLVMSAGGPATAASPSCAAPPAGAPSAPPPIGGFNAIAPVRLLDTRPTGLLAAGCVVAVDVSSVAPAQAAGIALNVTTTDARARGFVTAFPCGGPMPSTSNLNPRITDPTPNLVVVPLDSTRKVCLFTYAATNLLVDATGWFGGTGALFHEQAPQRIVDTRTAPRPDGGTGKLAAGSVLTIPMAGVSVPAGATAVAVNLTITEPDGPGYATAFPCGAPAPLTSQVNFLPGENRSNQAMVGLGNGALCVFVFASTHLVVDLAGWFGTADGGVPLQPILGARLLDTRNGTGGPTGAFAPGEMRVLDPSASGAVPAGAHDLLLNVVATQAAAPGYLSVFPCAGGVPATSSVNYAPGAESTNLVTVPIDNDGKVCIFSFERTHVVIDLLGAMGAPGNVRSLTVTGLALDPTFRPDVHDYTLACRGPANPVSYAAAAMPGTTLTVDGTAAGGTASGDVTLAENQALVVTAGTDQYFVRCLPHDFPPLTVSKTGPVAPGYYLMENGVAGGARFVMILDTNGVPVWYRRVSPSIDFKQLPDGNLAYMPFVRANFNIDPAQRYIETTLDGTVVRTIGTAPADGLDPVTDYHDLFPLTNGNFITVSYRVRPGSVTVPADYPPCGNGHTVIDGILQEVTPAGAVVWTWNSADHIDLSESVPVCDVPAISGASATNAYDLMHINSVDEDPASGDLVVSARYTNSILRISRSAAGTVLWKIGGYTAANHDGAVHFDVVGDPDGSFNLAHDVRWLPANGHITLFDNRANPNVPGVMRAAEYAIDAGTHTATFVWQRPIDGPCSTPTCKSFGLGSVRRQPDGNTVIAWGGESSPAFTEVDPAGNALLQVSLPVANLTYRVVKVPLTAFSLDQLHNTVSG